MVRFLNDLKGMRKKIFFVFLSIILILPGEAQFQRILKKKIKIPGLESLFQEEPPITTSLNDAQLEIPFLDDFTPQSPIPMGLMPVSVEGHFVLFPGAYVFDAQSYCLHAGAYAPSRGNGYILAPLKGKRAGIIRQILRNSVFHPEIPQQYIQTLIWAILARSSFENLSPEIQDVARNLLAPDELKQIKKNALDYLPGLVRDKAFQKLSPVLQKMYEAENNIRQILSTSEATYEQIEKAAVLMGDPPPDEADREIPEERWSYHPDGYFIRFKPFSYSHTRIEVYVPEIFKIVEDTSGRIRTVADSKDNRIEIIYQEDFPPPAREDEPVRAYYIRQIKILEKSPCFLSANQLTLPGNRGWTLFGSISRKKIPSHLKGFLQAENRYKKALQHQNSLLSLFANIHPKRKPKSLQDLRNLTALMNLYHLKEAVNDMFSPEEISSGYELLFLRNFLSRAWQYVFHLEARGEGLRSSWPFSSRDLDPPFDASGSAAMPGQTGRQRLAQSNRCKEGKASSPLGKAEDAVINALQNNGYAVDAASVFVYEAGGLICFAVRLGAGGNPLPAISCIEQQGNIEEGSQEGAKTLLIGCIQQTGDMTRATAREVDVETGEIGRTGKGDSNGTDQKAIEDALDKALGAF